MKTNNGIPEYTNWANVPETLKTKTALAKLGLKPAKGQPAAAFFTSHIYGRSRPKTYDLFDVSQAVPKPAPTPAQLAAIKKAQAAAEVAKHCAHCHVNFTRRGRYKHRYDHADGYICVDCFARHKESVDAQRLLADGFVVLDTETTGLDETAQIVSIGIIDHTGQVLLDTLVRPTISIPAEVVSIHGITDEMVATAPTIVQLYDQVRALLSGRTVVIYNAAFDLRLLVQSFRAASDTPLTEPDEWGMQTYCAMESCKTYLNRERWLSLTTAAEYFDLPTAGAHGAIADCLMTLGVLKGMAGNAISA